MRIPKTNRTSKVVQILISRRMASKRIAKIYKLGSNMLRVFTFRCRKLGQLPHIWWREKLSQELLEYRFGHMEKWLPDMTHFSVAGQIIQLKTINFRRKSLGKQVKFSQLDARPASGTDPLWPHLQLAVMSQQWTWPSRSQQLRGPFGSSHATVSGLMLI